MEVQVTLTVAQALEALASAFSQTSRPHHTVTMEEIRTHTGWGEKQAYRRVREMVADGRVKVVTVYEPNLLGRIVPKAGYQLT